MITREAWNRLGYDNCIQGCEILLQEDLCSVGLRQHLEQLVQRKAGKRLPCSPEMLDHVREALGLSYVIRKRDAATGSDVLHPLSKEQVSLIEAEFDGRPQLIRGVAGSGKTSVLVNNCVRFIDRLERASPNLFLRGMRTQHVAIVCYNRALAPFIQDQFDRSYREMTGRVKPDVKVTISCFNGLMYLHSTAMGGPLLYRAWQEDPTRLPGIAKDYLEQVRVLSSKSLESLRYDAIYVDEGQDLLDDEYRTLMHLLHADTTTGNKDLVIAYDDAQNVYGRPRPTWKELGLELRGRTHLMQTCFRNTRQTVEFAINVLLGTTAEKRAATRSFAETGYLKEKGLLDELDDRWHVHFAKRVGPHPEVQLFANRAEERAWVQTRLTNLLVKGARPEDILLLFLGTESAVMQFAPLVSILERTVPGLQAICVWGKNRAPDGRTSVKDSLLFQSGYVTLGTLQSLKGQDAAYVFLMGADLFSPTPQHRAAFYVGATRARNQLFVSGLDQVESLATEGVKVADLLNTRSTAFS